MPERAVEPSTDRVNEAVACDVCGHFDAVEFGDRLLCVDCYGSYGSCCPEFGREPCERPGSAGVPPA